MGLPSKKTNWVDRSGATEPRGSAMIELGRAHSAGPSGAHDGKGLMSMHTD